MTAGESLPADVCSADSPRLTGKPVLDGIGSTELLHIFISNSLTEQTPGHQRQGRARVRRRAPRRRTTPSSTRRIRLATCTCRARRSRPSGTGNREDATGCRIPRRLGANRRRLHAIRRRQLDVPRAQQRHDQGRRHLGLAGRGRERADRTPRRPRGRGGRCTQRRRAGRPWWRSWSPPPARRSTPPSLDAHCRDRMASFKRPRRIVVVDELPKTATGKIQRFALRERLGTP